MRASHRSGNGEAEEWEPMDSELGKGPVSVPEDGQDGLDGEAGLKELTSEFLSTPDPNAPDLDVVGRLYIAYFRHLVYVFERRANDRRQAQDAIQEAFTALQTYFTTHKKLPEDPKGFLFIAARNWLVNQARDDSRHREVSLLEQKSSTLDGLLDPRADAREPFEAMASSDMKDVAYPAVEELDRTTRKIIELRRKGKEWDAIAKRVGVPSGEHARKLFDHAVHHVKAALGAHFSSCVTTAEAEDRRCVNSRRSAEQAIDLLPAPYNKILQLFLVKKMTQKEIAAHLGVSLQEVERHHEHGVELFRKKYKMTQDDLLDALWHGQQ